MPDDLELVIDFVIEDSILYELAFLDLFYSDNLAIPFGGSLIDHCKSSFANIPNDVIIFSAIPCHAMVMLDSRGGKQSGRGIVECVSGLLPMWHHRLACWISTHTQRNLEKNLWTYPRQS